jgi:hypothetical protein
MYAQALPKVEQSEASADDALEVHRKSYWRWRLAFDCRRYLRATLPPRHSFPKAIAQQDEDQTKHI